jgi:hypothetical protein
MSLRNDIKPDSPVAGSRILKRKVFRMLNSYRPRKILVLCGMACSLLISRPAFSLEGGKIYSLWAQQTKPGVGADAGIGVEVQSMSAAIEQRNGDLYFREFSYNIQTPEFTRGYTGFFNISYGADHLKQATYNESANQIDVRLIDGTRFILDLGKQQMRLLSSGGRGRSISYASTVFRMSVSPVISTNTR